MDKVNYANGPYISKYVIKKSDGSLVDPNANYFVLRLDKDPHALVAISTYANSVEKDNPELASDLRKMVDGVTKGGKLSELVDSQTGKMFPHTEPEIPKLNNIMPMEIDGQAFDFKLVASSNVQAICFAPRTSPEGNDVIFVLFHKKGEEFTRTMYSYVGKINTEMHYEKMLDPTTSVGSYCHKLVKEFGFASTKVPSELIMKMAVPEPKVLYPMIHDFDSYQHHASKTAMYMDSIHKEFPNLPEKAAKLLGLSYAALGLGEAGEVQGKVKKLIRDSGGNITPEIVAAIAGEVGDILWYVNAMCKELNISLRDIAQGNVNKLFDRKNRGVITGSGDDR